MKVRRLNNSGAVAMISVVIFSIIITILVTAYARTIISQQREAINYDLSARAYYAAESGVQDVIRELAKTDSVTGEKSNTAKNGRQQCKQGGSYLGGNDTGLIGGEDLAVTCELVDLTPDSIHGTTSRSVSKLWQIKSAEDASKVQITWSSSPESDTNEYSLPEIGSEDRLFPSTADWGTSQYPPALRVEFINKSSGYTQRVYFVKPTDQSNGAASEPSFDAYDYDKNEAVQTGSCESGVTTSYSCSITFDTGTNLKDGAWYVVIHGVYGEADYSISPVDAANKLVGIKDTVATVDVTARAGSVLRRVQQQVDLSDSYQESWFDASALVVGDGVCKLFTVGTASSQYSNRCPSTSAP